MRIAYIIMAHDQPALFGRLIAAVEAPAAHTFAHIDAKSDEEPFRAAAEASDTTFVRDRVNVNWGGFSQVEATLRLLRTAREAGNHDYYVFLSGRDYPIRSNAAIERFLHEHAGLSFMNFHPLLGGATRAESLDRRAYYDLYARLGTGAMRTAVQFAVAAFGRTLPKRSFVPGYVPYRGSSSWCLTGAATDHVLRSIEDGTSQPLLDFFESTACSDELFFQTVILNSPLAHTCRNYQEDIVDREGRPMLDENKAGLHHIDWSQGRDRPAILDIQDFAALISSDKLFARKFDQSRSAELLDRIDEYRATE